MKKIGIFLLIVVTFICTLQATWSYFKDTKTISSAFHSEGLLSKVSVEISNQSFDFDKESTTATITVKNNSSVAWNKDSVKLYLDTPTYTLNNQEYKLTNLFGTYYTVTIAQNIQDNVAVFTLTVQPKKAEGIDLRLGIADIKFNVSVKANYGKNNKPLTIHNSEDYIKIVSTPWNWPSDDKFKQNVYIMKMADDNDRLHESDFHITEYHTPMYYGPGTKYSVFNRYTWTWVSVVPSMNVFPSLRFIRNSDIIGSDKFEDSNGNLNFDEQKTKAMYLYPKNIRYGNEDPDYSLTRGPVYYIPSKGFVSAYYMTYKDEVNDYGVHGPDGNPVFKRLYIYNNNYYYIVSTQTGLYSGTYQLKPINQTILDYINNSDINGKPRFATKSGNDLVANYNDYNNRFVVNDVIYNSQYAESNFSITHWKIMLGDQVIKSNY